MHESITIADVGSIVNVSGSRIATPLGPPRPGNTPTKMPSNRPSSISARIFQVSSTAKPCISSEMASTLSTEEGFDRPLGHQHVEGDIEREEHRDREHERGEERFPPRDAADPAHEAG